MSLQKCACGARREQPCRAAARVPTAASCPHSRPPLALTAAARARAAVLPHAHPGLPGLHGVRVCAPRQPVGVHAARRAAPAPGQTPHPMLVQAHTPTLAQPHAASGRMRSPACPRTRAVQPRPGRPRAQAAARAGMASSARAGLTCADARRCPLSRAEPQSGCRRELACRDGVAHRGE